jgi:hypothetical protein
MTAPADDCRIPLVREGVGCESCHGPAGDWIGPHTEAGWSTLDPRRKQDEYGMVPARDLAAQARACAGCHVGEPAHDGLPAKNVDHDLIAAGHPRLTFEFSAYLANLPKHWREDRWPDAAADFPARAWAIGQVASVRAAVDLLAYRAGSRPKSPWPELSEYGCFSCHHDLRDEAWRRQPGSVKTTPGRPRWGTWYSSRLLDRLAIAAPGRGAEAAVAGLEAIRGAMGGLDPDTDAFARAADGVSPALANWLEALAPKEARLDVAKLREAVSSLPVQSWDEATQRYLALVPIAQALGGPKPYRDPATKEDLCKLRDRLMYPDRFDSPRGFDPTHR